MRWRQTFLLLFWCLMLSKIKNSCATTTVTLNVSCPHTARVKFMGSIGKLGRSVWCRVSIIVTCHGRGGGLSVLSVTAVKVTGAWQTAPEPFRTMYAQTHTPADDTVTICLYIYIYLHFLGLLVKVFIHFLAHKCRFAFYSNDLCINLLSIVQIHPQTLDVVKKCIHL